MRNISAMRRQSLLKANKKQAGFSLIEILVGLVLLTVLAVAVSFSFDGSRSRAQSLISSMGELGKANIRVKADTGCYASAPVALFNEVQGKAQANNFCNKDLSKTWNGPYITAIPVDGTGNATLDQVGDGVTVDFDVEEVTIGGQNRKIYFVLADGLPEDVVTAALQACNNSEVTGADSVTFTGDDNFRCRGSAANGQFAMRFDQTR